MLKFYYHEQTLEMQIEGEMRKKDESKYPIIIDEIKRSGTHIEMMNQAMESFKNMELQRFITTNSSQDFSDIYSRIDNSTLGKSTRDFEM